MKAGTRAVLVTEATLVTPQVRRFTLRAANGGLLPAWSAGSHIGVTLTHQEQAWQNSYSLIGTPGETAFYQIAVRREDPARSRGGSRHLHERIKQGDTLEISGPANHFPLPRQAKRHVLIAGGIGITPFLAYMAAFQKAAMPFELHYAFRSRREGTFCEAICAQHGVHAHFYVSEEGRRLSPGAILAAQPLGTHVSVCGPRSLIDAVVEAASAADWPAAHVHWEEFARPPLQNATPFLAYLPEIGKTVPVGPQETLLEALEAAGVPLASSCRVGMCGTCEVRVLDGTPDHRDRCFSAEEQAGGRMLACVSRSRSERLALALPGKNEGLR